MKGSQGVPTIKGTFKHRLDGAGSEGSTNVKTQGRRPVDWDRMMRKMGSEKQWARSSKALKDGRWQCSLERE